TVAHEHHRRLDLHLGLEELRLENVVAAVGGVPAPPPAAGAEVAGRLRPPRAIEDLRVETAVAAVGELPAPPPAAEAELAALLHHLRREQGDTLLEAAAVPRRLEARRLELRGGRAGRP